MSLLDYIKGQRRGKDAHRLEREAMQDSFLSDAIDGFDTVDGRHAENIKEMRHRITQRVRRTNRWQTYAGIAASLLLALSFGVYLLFVDRTDDYLATSDAPVKQETPAKSEKPILREEACEYEEACESEASVENDAQTESEPPLARKKEKKTAPRKEELITLVSDEVIVDNAIDVNDVAMEIVEEALEKKRDTLVYHRLNQGDNVYCKQEKVAQIKSEQSVPYFVMEDAPALVAKKGVVVDEHDNPLAGVTVAVEGSVNGVITGVDGTFSIDVLPTDTLIFSYLGMQQERLEVGNEHDLAVVMEENDANLDEVVVVAFGKQKKESVIGSITTQPATKQKTKTGAQARNRGINSTEMGTVLGAKPDKKRVTPEPFVGWKEYKKYLKQSLRRPTAGDCAQVKGTVGVAFYVDELGKPYDLQVVQSLCPDADAEAKRLIQQGYRWTTGLGQVIVKVKF